MRVSHRPVLFHASGRLLLMLCMLAVSVWSSAAFAPVHMNGIGLPKTALPLAADSADESQQCLQDVTLAQLVGSDMIYAYSYLRRYVSLTTLNDEKDWTRPDLILTQDGPELKDRGYNHYLRYPITVDAIYEFLCEPNNVELLSDQNDIDRVLEDKGFNVGVMNQTIADLRSIGGHIVEFDDEWQTSDLVYAVFVNWDKKRITITFRGSVKNTKDWNTNFKFRYVKEPLPKPEQLADETIKKEDDIRVHRGFHGYVFQETPEDTIKYEDVVGQIKRLYSNEKYKDYELFVTGHSLGAALASYLAYNLAGSNEVMGFLPGPVTAITFASPAVGNGAYRSAFEALERKGNLRYIRYSNQGDVVAVAPFGFGYRQTGLHAFLPKKTAMQVGFPNWKRSTTQFRLPSTMNTAHSLTEHKARLEQDYNAELLLSKTVEEFFDEYYTGVDDSGTPQ